MLHPGLILSMLLIAVPGFSEEPPDKTDPWPQIFLHAAKSYELTNEQGAPLQLRAKPLLNWSNPERNTGAGAIFLWTDDGRPAAVMCIYPRTETMLDHEFQSLSATKFKASFNDRTVWTPQEPGVIYKPFADVPPPAQARRLRLTQMRGLARTFSARIVITGESPKPLRLMPTPIYRYPESEKDPAVVDGAVFAFVQGTDPEVLLMIEAARDNQDTLHWRYACARMSIVPLEAAHNGQIIWHCALSPNRGTPIEGYYTIQNIPLEKPQPSDQ